MNDVFLAYLSQHDYSIVDRVVKPWNTGLEKHSERLHSSEERKLLLVGPFLQMELSSLFSPDFHWKKKNVYEMLKTWKTFLLTVLENLTSTWSRDTTYFVFEVSCFRFCQIKFVCIDAGMCDPVHDVETVFRFC